MSRKNGKPGNRASTVTLLRRLASTAKKDDVKLRAIELLLFLEGKVSQQQVTSPSKAKEANGLNGLISLQAVDSTPNANEKVFDYGTIETELLSAAR